MIIIYNSYRIHIEYEIINIDICLCMYIYLIKMNIIRREKFSYITRLF